MVVRVCDIEIHQIWEYWIMLHYALYVFGISKSGSHRKRKKCLIKTRHSLAAYFLSFEFVLIRLEYLVRKLRIVQNIFSICGMNALMLYTADIELLVIFYAIRYIYHMNMKKTKKFARKSWMLIPLPTFLLNCFWRLKNAT